MSDQPDHQPARYVHEASAEKQASALTDQQKEVAIRVIDQELRTLDFSPAAKIEVANLRAVIDTSKTIEVLADELRKTRDSVYTRSGIDNRDSRIFQIAIDHIATALGLQLGRAL